MISPFFSIITPVYNSEKYIEECIESVLSQTFQEWELILINDGSTDNGGKICDKYCSDPRIRVIHQQNEGALCSRLRGIEHAKGQYILGLDADDYLETQCLQIVWEAIRASDSDLVFFGFRYIGDKEGIIRCSLKERKKYSKREILEIVISETNHSLCNKAIKTEKVRQAEYKGLAKQLSVNLDYAQIIPILCNIDNGYVINEVLYNYRIYGESISHAYKTKHIVDTGIVTEFVSECLDDFKLLDPTMKELVNKAYLEMICPRLYRVFLEDKIKNNEYKIIRNSKVYINARNYESLKNLGLFNFVILKIFRYRQYWLLRLLAKVRKIKNKVACRGDI